MNPWQGIKLHPRTAEQRPEPCVPLLVALGVPGVSRKGHVIPPSRLLHTAP